MSTLTKVLIALGILAVLGLGTCAAGAIWLGGKAREVSDGLADGGLVLVAPPAVVAELAGPKKDYVGLWTSTSGKSTLDIKPDGSFRLEQDEKGKKETLAAPIAKFVGDDLEVKFGITFKLGVTTAPHRAGARWEMVARGITFQRD